VTDVLARYFDAMRAQDWDALADCVAPDVHRTGPYRDEVRGREAYVAFRVGVVPKLANYALDVQDVRPLADGGALVRLTESMDHEGTRRTHPEALLFDFDAEGRIARVDVYLKRSAPGA
jgi:uncharacterized protein (TIGR02246 family)